MIRLIVSDIDGCLTRGGTQLLPLEFFIELQQWNRRAREDSSVPPVTMCTGRPQPYVEAIMQATGCYMPVLCESGGVLYGLTKRTLHFHPHFTSEYQKHYNNLLKAVLEGFLGNGRPIVIEPGKHTEITLVPIEPLTVAGIWDEAREFIAPWSGIFKVSRTKSVVNFSFRDIDKEQGLLWLSETLGIACGEMAGFGDTEPDIGFLQRAGISGCPANAMQEVKEVVDYESPYEYYKGFIDFLQRITASAQ